MLSRKSRLYECIYNRLTAAIFLNDPFLEFRSISFLSDCFAPVLQISIWIPLLFKVQGRLLVLVNRDEPAVFDRMEIAVFAGAKTITYLSFLSLVYFIYFLSFFFYLCIFFTLILFIVSSLLFRFLIASWGFFHSFYDFLVTQFYPRWPETKFSESLARKGSRSRVLTGMGDICFIPLPIFFLLIFSCLKKNSCPPGKLVNKYPVFAV